MRNLKVLNTREKKAIYKLLEEQWGFKGKIEHVMLQSPKNKIYIINPEFARADISKLRVDSIGLYFAEIKGDVRLSIEGSQLIGNKCSKNILEVNDRDFRLWLKGNDLETKEKNLSGFVIIKHENDFCGTGKYKEGKILNFVPKTRRILAED